jgi:WD40 repeat protein
MRFLRGGSLEDLIGERPLELEPAAKILDQVGAALAAAHHQGVVHRDVKPGNVLLDEDGNAYLSDFGIALETGAPEQTAGTMIRGTPAYLSPEQIKLEQTTPRSDIYALGVVLYEMLTGEHPFPGTSLNVLLDQHLHHPIPSVRDKRPDVPPTVDAAIARATAKDPQARFGDVLELCAAFRGATGGKDVQVVVRGELRNPYKGLRAFLEADSADFFGRELLTRRLVERLAENGAARFLCLVGPSGSGKSSVARAGLVPAIRRGVIPGSDRWYVVDLVPGAHPLRALETALLAVSVNPPPSLLEELERDEHGLTRAVDRLLPDPDAELVIVLDQLEELFTMVDSDAERAHLLESIRVATADQTSRIRVIATLRADFFDQPLSVRGFGDLLAARNEAITPMSPEEIERAIVGPADRVGLDVEPGLVAAMVADVIDRPGALPLLQYALTELADREDVGALTLHAYRKIGGVSGALARRAEHLYDALDETGRVACRQLFLWLVTLGEGTEDTRHRVRRSGLPHLDGGAMDAVIDAFGRHRLLSFDRDTSTREPTIEIAHEALLRAWSRLRGWIDEAREDLRIRNGLAASAAEWNLNGRDESFLLRGARLESMASWAETTTIALSTGDLAYLGDSVRTRDIERAEEETRLARERGLERRSIRRLRGLVALGVTAALVATTLTVVAVNQRSRAERESRVATARELAGAAVTNLEIDPERSILLALAAVDATRGDGSAIPEAEEALHRSVSADRQILAMRNISWGGFFALSPDGRLLITQGPDSETTNELLVRDAVTGARLETLPPMPHEDFGDASFSPDGARLASIWGDSTVIVWDARSWARAWTVNLDRAPEIPSSLAFSPDGSLLAVVGSDGIVSMLDADTGHELRRMRVPGSGFLSVAFSADGTRVAATVNFGSGQTVVWDVRTGDRVLTLDNSSLGVAYSPDERHIATSDFGGGTGIWDARTGRELMELDEQTGPVWAVAYSTDGQLLATAGDDGSARIWDARSGEPLLVLRGHTGAIFEIRFSPDGARLMTGSGDGTVRVWDISPSGSRELVTMGAPASLDGVSYSPDGARLLAMDWRGAARQWETTTGEEIGSARTGGWNDAVYSPDGRRFVTAGRPFVRDASSGGVVGKMRLDHEEWIESVAYSPDGSLIAGGLGAGTDESGTVAMWDASTGERVETLGEPAAKINSIQGLAFSPDGTLLAGINGIGTAHVWNVSVGKELITFEAHQSNGGGVAFSPDGTLLATSGTDGAALWAMPSGEKVATLAGHAGNVEDVAFSSDGTLVATADQDGTAGVWDAATGRKILTMYGSTDALSGVAFSPDGSTLATSSFDGTVREYVLDTDELISLARADLTRGFTDAECRQYLHLSRCPASPGIAAPTNAGAREREPSSPADGPEGAFRVTIVPADLKGPFSKGEIDENIGDYTLSLFGGAWRLHQDRPRGGTWDTSGTYTVSNDRISLIDQQDPGCFGLEVSARWSLAGTTLSITDVDTLAVPCGDRAFFEAALEGVYASHDWQRII